MTTYDDALAERAARAIWDDVDDKGILGRLFREDCTYVARVVISAVAPAIEAKALRKCAKEALERGDIGRDGCIEVWDWLNIRADQIEGADHG